MLLKPKVKRLRDKRKESDGPLAKSGERLRERITLIPEASVYALNKLSQV